MSNVIQFPKPAPTPGPEVAHKIDTAIKLYAASRWTRQQLMTYIANILDSYKISRMQVRNYSVRKVEPVDFGFTYPVVMIEANEKIYTQCPVCDSRESLYVSGESPVIEVWCADCGCIYRKESTDEKTCKSSRSVDMDRGNN